MIETAIGSDLGVGVSPTVGGNSVINETDSTSSQELGNDKVTGVSLNEVSSDTNNVIEVIPCGSSGMVLGTDVMLTKIGVNPTTYSISNSNPSRMSPSAQVGPGVAVKASHGSVNSTDTLMNTVRPVTKQGGDESFNLTSNIESEEIFSTSIEINNQSSNEMQNSTQKRGSSVLEDNHFQLLQPKKSSRNINANYRKDKYTDYVLLLDSETTIPTTFSEIELTIEKQSWLQAVDSELKSLEKNNTWTLVNPPTHKSVIRSKWVFNIKVDELGNPKRFKARLVAKGFQQTFMKDYNEIFAPVARITTLRFILALANQFDYNVHHMDVKKAFLNGDLEEDIYMHIPEGIEHDGTKVWMLNKSLYGLKQAARCWFKKFDTVLRGMGFEESMHDRCLYVKKSETKRKLFVSKLTFIMTLLSTFYFGAQNLNGKMTNRSFINFVKNKDNCKTNGF